MNHYYVQAQTGHILRVFPYELDHRNFQRGRAMLLALNNSKTIPCRVVENRLLTGEVSVWRSEKMLALRGSYKNLYAEVEHMTKSPQETWELYVYCEGNLVRREGFSSLPTDADLQERLQTIHKQLSST